MSVVLTLLLFHFTGEAQRNTVPPLPLKGSDIRYEETVIQEGYTKDLLFTNAEKWFNNNYETADTKLTVDNKTTGIVAGVGSSNNDKQHRDNVIFFHFNIVVRDEGYTYSIDSIYSTTSKDKFLYADMYREERFPAGKPRWTKEERYLLLTNMDKYIKAVIQQLKGSMMKK
jgi:hypothetical protein